MKLIETPFQANHRILTYMKYSYLWTESRNDTMYYFLNWGRQLTPDGLDMLNEDENLVSKKNDKGKTNEETSP